MPYEFKDLSKQVEKGAKLVDKELKKMIVNTDKVDKSQKKLTKTQKSALQITEKYRKSLKSLNREFVVIKKTSLLAAKSLSVFSGRKIMHGMTGLAATVEDLNDNLKDLSKTKAVVSVGIEGAEDAATFTKDVGKLSKTRIKGLPKDIDAIDKSARHAGRSVGSLGKEFDRFGDEVRKMRGLTDLVAASFDDGKRTAGYFADGLGKTDSRMIAAGVAAFYLLQKTGDLIDQFKDARMELGRFNVVLATAGKTTLGADASQLKSFQDELSLTRAQASQFFGVLKDGSKSGVISVQEMVDAAGKLQSAFGGDPTERLRTYVDLLKEIPTLDTDLKVTASLDDKAASLFDLAKKGKISEVIELQQAGLAGGLDTTATSPEDVKLLNSNQKTEKYTEDIRDYLLTKLFPSFGPQLSAIAEYTFKALGVVGGGVAAAGAASLFFIKKQNQQIRATERVENAIWNTAGKGAAGRRAGGSLSTRDFRGIKDAFSKGFKRGGGGMAGVARGARGAAMSTGNVGVALFAKDAGAAIKAMSKMSKGALIATKTLFRMGLALKVIAGPAALIGLAFDAAGIAADWMSKRLEDAGDKGGAAYAKMASASSKTAGTITTLAVAGAALGTLFAGPLGTAVGATIGALAGLAVGVWNNMGTFGTAVESFGKDLNGTITVAGKPIKKYVASVSEFGDKLEYAGGFLSEWSKEIKTTTGDYSKAAWELIKSAAVLAYKFSDLYGAVGVVADYFKGFGVGKTPDYDKALEDSSELLEEAGKAAGKMAVSGKEFEKLWGEALDRDMKSALALEQSFNDVEATAKTGKVSLADFQKEVAGLDLDMLSDAGGSAKDFEDAVETSSRAVRSKLKILADGFAEDRKKISARTDLDAQSRKAALLNLHKEELAATKEFINGMSGVIDYLFKTPKAIASGLKSSISGAKMDISAGSLSTDEMGKELKEGTNSAIDGFMEALDASSKVEGKIREMGESRATAEKTLRETSPDQLKDSKGKVKAAFAGVFEPIKDAEGKEIGIGVKDAKLAAERLKQMNAAIGEMGEEIDATSKEAEAGTAQQLAKNAVKIAESLAVASEGLNKANMAAEAALGSADKSEAANKEVAEKSKTIQSLKVEQAKAEEKMASTYKRLGLTTKESKEGLKAALAKNDQKAIAKYASAGGDEQKEAAEAFIKQTAQMEKSNAALKENNELIENRKKLQEDASVLENAITASTDLTIAALKEQQKNLANILAAQDETTRRVDESVNAEDATVFAAKLRVDALRNSEEEAALAGDSIKHLAETSEAETALYQDIIESNRVKIDNFNEDIAKLSKALSDPSKSKEDKAAIQKQIGTIEDGKNRVNRASNEAARGVAEAMDMLENAIAGAGKSKRGKEAQLRIDLSGAQMELAAFSKDAKGMVAAAVETAKKGLAERRKVEQDFIEESYQSANRTARGQVSAFDKLRLAEIEAKKEAGKLTDEEYRQAIKEHKLKVKEFWMAKDQVIEAEKQKATTQSELKYKQDMMKLAEDALSIERTKLDISDQILAAQMDFAQESGASYSTVMDLQKKQVENSRKELENAQKALEIAKQGTTDSAKLAEFEKNVTIAEINLKKKQLGVQRDIFEKMIGAALGDIRSSVGARRQRGTDISVMGTDATRVKDPSGMYQKAPAGGIKSYQDRLNELRLGGKDERGAGRIGAEKDLSAGLNALKKPTGETAKATGDLARAGLVKNSIFTHDATQEGLLTNILRVETGISEAVWRLAGVEGGGAANARQLREAVQKVDFPSSMTDKAGMSEQTESPWSQYIKQASQSELALLNQGTAKPEGGYEAAIPPAGATGGTAKIDGKITVHFDSGVFRDEVAAVVGTIIQTPEIQKSLQKTNIMPMR